MKLRDELSDKVNSHFDKIGANTKDVFNYGFDACEARYKPMIEKLESALKATKHDYWFMISLIERTTDDKYLKDAVSDCVYRMKFRQPMFDYALAELAEFKNKMNGGE